MFKGTVSLTATITGASGVQFDRFEFDPKEPGVDRVEIEGPTGFDIRIVVSFSSVPSEDDAKQIAQKVAAAALDRTAFSCKVPIESARIGGTHLLSLDLPPGTPTVAVSDVVCLTDSYLAVKKTTPDLLKTELERPRPPGGQYYGLFRSALQSTGPVEKFIFLYAVLQTVKGKQVAVDGFILKHEPTVPRTRHPMFSGQMETVYTRLRNEFNHSDERGVNLDDTKREMQAWLGRLIDLTWKAIETAP
jgi:hypothetical protein